MTASHQDYSRSRVLGRFDYHGIKFKVARTKINGRPFRKHTVLLVDKIPLSSCSYAFPASEGEVSVDMWHAKVARMFMFPDALQDAVINTKQRVVGDAPFR